MCRWVHGFNAICSLICGSDRDHICTLGETISESPSAQRQFRERCRSYHKWQLWRYLDPYTVSADHVLEHLTALCECKRNFCSLTLGDIISLSSKISRYLALPAIGWLHAMDRRRGWSVLACIQLCKLRSTNEVTLQGLSGTGKRPGIWLDYKSDGKHCNFSSTDLRLHGTSKILATHKRFVQDWNCRDHSILNNKWNAVPWTHTIVNRLWRPLSQTEVTLEILAQLQMHNMSLLYVSFRAAPVWWIRDSD